jgi:endonuclease/exonuclease/phosphatase (EEP) superfamily protein YafD
MRWLDRLLVFLAAIAVVANVLPLGARLSWTLELTTHFRIQYLAVTAALLVLALMRRRWGWCAVLAAAGAVSAAPVLPYLPLAPVAPAAVAAGAAPIKVLTVNVSFRPFSPRRFLEIVREAQPDVVVLQELTPHAENVLAELDKAFPHYRKFPADGAYGIGVWSRHELESGETFALGVHLSAPTSPRRAAARTQELIELATRSANIEDPLVVAGDFNVTPYSPYFVQWLEQGALTDSRRGRTLSVSWPTTLPWAGIPIDHVAVNKGFTILSHRRLPNFESDHYAVLVELALRHPD